MSGRRTCPNGCLARTGGAAHAREGARVRSRPRCRFKLTTKHGQVYPNRNSGTHRLLSPAERRVRSQTPLTAIQRESEAIQQQLDLTQRRIRVAGRISYFLEVADEGEAAPSTDHLRNLEARIAELREDLDNSNKMDRLIEAQQQVALSATEILNDLPFTALYPQRTVYVNTRDLSAGILTPQRRIPMRDIGSDENYLSLHVAVSLGLHRYFKLHERPVPGK